MLRLFQCGRDVLVNAVWGEDQPDSNSLKVHMHNLRKAVDAPFSEPMIQTISGTGFAIKVSEKDVVNNETHH